MTTQMQVLADERIRAGQYVLVFDGRARLVPRAMTGVAPGTVLAKALENIEVGYIGSVEQKDPVRD